MKVETKSSKIFFFIILALVFYISFQLLKPYFAVLILAFITTLFFRPLFRKIMKWTKEREGLSILLTILSIIITFLIPFILLADLIYIQTKQFNEDVNEAISESENFNENNGKLNTIYDIAIKRGNEFLEKVPFTDYRLDEEKLNNFVQDSVEPVSDYVLNKTVSWTTSLINFIPMVVIFFIIVGTLLSNEDKFFDYLKKISPLKDEIDELYIKRFVAMSRATIKGTFVIAAVQAIISGLSLWIAGVDYVVFFTILMVFAGVIPIGVGIVSAPIALILFLTGDIVGGLIILLTLVLVVSNVDNYLRPKLVSKDANLHSVLLLLGFLGGIEMFGFMGLIYGPIIMIFLATTLEVYMKYYKE
jgi:predicted PurR-regulated permease PerM